MLGGTNRNGRNAASQKSMEKRSLGKIQQDCSPRKHHLHRNYLFEKKKKISKGRNETIDNQSEMKAVEKGSFSLLCFCFKGD